MVTTIFVFCSRKCKQYLSTLTSLYVNRKQNDLLVVCRIFKQRQFHVMNWVISSLQVMLYLLGKGEQRYRCFGFRLNGLKISRQWGSCCQ